MQVSKILYRPLSFTRKYIVDSYLLNQENKCLVYMVRKAIYTKNSELLKVMNNSNLISPIIKKEVFQELCYFSDYEQIQFMMDNVFDIRHNLKDYIKYIETCSGEIDKTRIEKNLSLLEQELN